MFGGAAESLAEHVDAPTCSTKGVFPLQAWCVIDAMSQTISKGLDTPEQSHDATSQAEERAQEVRKDRALLALEKAQEKMQHICIVV